MRAQILVVSALLLAAGCAMWTQQDDFELSRECVGARSADDLIKNCSRYLDAVKGRDDYWVEEALRQRGVGYSLKHEYDLALKDFDAAARRTPNDPEVFFDRAGVYAVEKRFDQALADYDKVIALNSEYIVEAFADRGLTQLWRHQPDLALADLNHAIALAPDARADYYVRRAYAYSVTHRFDLAVADLRHVLDLEPHNVFAEDGLCRTLAFNGHAYEAREHCERLVNAYPHAPRSMFARGYAELRTGDWKGALADCDAAAAATPVLAAPLFCSAYARERLGDDKAAKAGYAEAHAADPKVDEAMKRLGIVPGQVEIKPVL